MMATGDTEEFEAMSHEACGFCDGVITDAATIQKEGQTFTGSITHATVRETYKRDGLTGVWPLDVDVRQNEAQVVDSDGHVAATTQAHEGLVRVEMGIEADQWVVVGIIEKDEP
ncbi:hypothetical protein EDD34_0053 [Myceligenerans xiligouense]|uniref:DUF6318 domain-containing protein n=1 Tax=Myceligenerans xiligouense TaxID=253184 RepID=A0A3N4YJN5_9MICO|nr:hypothetical protein EDD34_0053 [Myceligenerans xiligouense]